MRQSALPPLRRVRRGTRNGASLDRRVRALPWLLGAAAVLCQIAYPLTSGQPRTTLTIVTVVAFCAASVAHAWVHRGPRWALTFVAVTAAYGLLVEAIGVRTGVPFGDYAYTDSLGWQLLGVPLVIPLAWTMMAYPALIAARRLTRRWVPIVGGLALASWDLFLDPQMVAAQHWSWLDASTTIPGIPGIPVSNFVGWLVVSVILMALLGRALPDQAADDRLPAALYLWTYASQVLGNAVFFDRPYVALVGGMGMGLVALPYAYVLWRDRP